MHYSDVDLLSDKLGFEDRFIWDADIEDWRLKDCNNNLGKKRINKQAKSLKDRKDGGVAGREFLQNVKIVFPFLSYYHDIKFANIFISYRYRQI